MLDYAILKFIWWILVGVLLLGFSVMDGHDMGVGTLLPFMGKNDDERRVLINSVGPHWEGNQVWFVTAGGAIFAAWPLIYATAFSGFYFAMLAVLWALFFRPVGFDYRSKMPSLRWRFAWDWGIFAGSVIPALIFGVAFGNVIQGVPFHFDETMMVFYTGSFWALLNPFAILCGVISVSMFIAHGANYLLVRTEGVIQDRARKASIVAAIVMMVCFAIAGFVVSGMSGYVVTSTINTEAAVNPLTKEVVRQAGAWMTNYHTYPVAILAPVLGFLGGLASILLASKGKGVPAFIASGVAMAGVIFTAGVSLFPFVLPSSSDPVSSLTVWDCVSSQLTLSVMFWVALVMTPIIIIYTSWAYHVMRGRVTVESIRANDHTAY